MDATESLGLTELYHVGIVVRDLDDAVARFTNQVGISPWAIMDTEVPGRYRGEQTTARARIAYARSGLSYIELVQPTAGRWTAQAYLDEHGEGAYHLGYWVQDIGQTIALAKELGIALDLTMPADEPVAAYLDASGTFGVHIELVDSSIRAALEGWIAGAGA